MFKVRMNEVSVPIRYTDSHVKNIISRRLGIQPEDILSWELWKKSVDARKGRDVRYILTLDIALREKIVIRDKKTAEATYVTYHIKKTKPLPKRPVVVGFGPGGMFAALILAESGQRPIVLERGSCVEERRQQVQAFWQDRVLNPSSNVQFGEGGAGTFSDGKLTTGVKDQRIQKVLGALVENGAPKEILWEAKPHIGTDHLPKTVRNIRERIKALGGEVRFHSQVTGLLQREGKIAGVKVSGPKGTEEIETDDVILSIGHSARDTFQMLWALGLPMEAKAFSVGARIEHLAEKINSVQYGVAWKKLPAADYKLSAHLINGRGVYTFCMCPGGEVVGATSVEEGVVTNGMSNFKRDGVNSNAAVLVGVTPKDFGSEHWLAGVKFQEQLEKTAYVMGGRDYSAPVQRVEDFLRNRPTKAFGEVKPTYRPGTAFENLRQLLPDFVGESMAMGLKELSKRLPGFDHPDALLTGPETRSSSPVRILRGEDCQSLGLIGLYPCGEGAGYAGGIMSAAVDGIRCAESVLRKTQEITP